MRKVFHYSAILLALIVWGRGGQARTEWPVSEGGNGHFYEAVQATGDWATAKADAIARGGYLATITSEEENNFVFSLIDDYDAFWNSDFGPWLGGWQLDNQDTPDTGWQWVTSEAWSFSKWAGGEPNDQGDYEENNQENYLTFYAPFSVVTSPEWTDMFDNPNIKGYIVEYEPNQSPLADAGPDQTVEQTSHDGAEVTLDGSGSSDPDEDPLTYSWTWPGGSATGVNPTVTLPLGTTSITLVVNDGQVDSPPDTVDIAVVDTTPPVLTVQVDGVEVQDQDTVRGEQSSHAGRRFELRMTAQDVCDVEPTITLTIDGLEVPLSYQGEDEPPTWTASLDLNLGDHTAVVTATDHSDQSPPTTVTVTLAVVDTTPPELTCPEDIEVEQEEAAGTQVEWVCTATDLCDAAPEIVCDPPSGTVFPLGVTTVTCTATDASGNSTTQTFTVTVTALNLQPDLWVQQEETWLGDGIYNADGTDQTGTQTIGRDTSAIYQAQLYNDGDVTQTFWLQGTESSADWLVEYYAGTEVDEAQKVTDQVTSEQGWEIPDLPPGGAESFLITVTPGSSVFGTYPVLVTAIPDWDPTQLDALQAITTAPYLQPDLLIQQENDWLGNDVYNADGTDQTGTQKVVTGTPAVYQAQLYNDGDTTDTFWVQGTEGNADWTVEYYAGTEVLEAQKVTAQVTSPEGWEISDLPPGEGENFIITVTPNAGVAGSYPVLVTATSNLDDTLVDAIQAVTTEWPVTEGENGHYYEAVLVPEGIDWNQANAAAIAAGGYLATITSEEENELVYNLVKGTAFWRWPQGPWLGGRQQEGMEEPAAGWEWVTGETWDYTPWYDGEPNDYFEEIDEDRLNFEHGATWNDFPQTELTNGYVVEYMEAHWQPDLWIKSAGSWQGDDIYHPTGENQVGRRKVEGGTTVKYLARLYNDGDEAANFWIQGPGGDGDWTVQYYRGTQVDPAKEVTAQVTSGLGWKRANVPPGSRRNFVIAVTPASGIVGDCAVLVQATSDQDPAQVDCIQAITTVPDVQPDLHIKKGPVWGGDDIYNDDGTGQKASRKVTAGSSALFRARLENDGNGKDHFYIFGPSGNEDWTVQYYRGAKIDAAKEVTADVTSAEGWKRPNVAPGKMRSFLIVVTPRSGVAAGEQYEALVRAEAKRDPYQSDALKTVTTVKEE